MNTCLIRHHDGKNIITVCLAPECKGKRICCSQCQSEFHKHHSLDQLIDFNTLHQFIINQSQNEGESQINETQSQQELKKILQDIDQLSKLIKIEIQRQNSNSVNLQQFCFDLGNKYNIFTQDIGNRQWNELAQDLLSRIELKNNQIIEKQIQLGQPYLIFLYEFSRNMIKIVNELNVANQMFDQNRRNKNQQIKKHPLQKQDILVQNPFTKFNKSELLKSHSNSTTSIEICEYRNLLVSVSDDRKVKIWDYRQNTLLQSFGGIGGRITAMAISGLGNFLAVCQKFNEFKTFLLNISDLKHLFEVPKSCSFDKQETNRLVFSDDQIYLIQSKIDGKVIIQYVQTLEEFGKFSTGETISGLSISSDNKFIATHSSVRGIQIWNFQTQSLIYTHKPHNFGIAIQFSKFQNKLVTSGADGIINVFDCSELDKDRLIQEGSFKVGQRGIQNVIVTSDSKYILSYSHENENVKVIDLATGQEMKVFNLKNKNKYLQSPNIRGLAITKNMDMIMYGDGKDIVIWRMV